MNFNLVSPTTNGNEYTVRFNEPITIDADSQIYMNFAQLERKNLITFRKPQTATINIQNKHVYPRVYPEDPTLANDPFYTLSEEGLNVATISAGQYTYSELSEALTTELDNLFHSNDEAPTQTSNLESYTVRDADNLVLNRDNDIVIGISLGEGNSNDDRYDFLPITQDPSNIHDATISAESEFTKTSATAATAIYDCYCMSHEFYHHLAMKCEDKAIANNLIQLSTNKNILDMTGDVTVGIYSRYYAEDLGGNFSRTHGTSAPKLSGSALNAFVSFEITHGASPQLIIRSATSAEGAIEDWSNINQEITGMEELRRFPVTNLLNGNFNQPFTFAIQTYIRDDEPSLRENPNIYFRVMKSVAGDGPIEEGQVIYDSVQDNRYIPHSFLVAKSGLVYDTPRRVNSQIPFNLLLSATDENEGFSAIDMRQFNKDTPVPDPAPGSGFTNKVQSLITEYKLEFSKELAVALGSTISGSLYPNICEALYELQFVTDMSGLWKTKSYSIYLENLPINNYKNTEESRNAGFTKAILANIPVPFGKDSELIEGRGTKNDGNVVAVYQPYNPIYSDMKNNVIQTNQFNVKIVDMSDETPAVDITKSTINFTIRSPK